MSSRSERLLRAIADGDWWRANAACRGSETDLWFDRARWSEALIYCQNCPVANLCLDYGLKFERECTLHPLRGRTGFEDVLQLSPCCSLASSQLSPW